MEDDINEIIEEKIIKETGEITVRKFKKMIFSEEPKNYYKFIDCETKEAFICKIVPNIELIKANQKHNLINEIKIHKLCKNSNIVSILHNFEDEENTYILYEFCKNGTLDDLLRKRKTLTELEVKYYAKQIINALKYLHKNKIIHRNLKLSNIFLTDKMEIKIAGFNIFSILKTKDEKIKLKTICGTPNYLAPEILDENMGYSYEVDIWALGIVIYKLIIGKLPFDSTNISTICEKIKKIEFTFPENANISDEAKDLIKNILVIDPKKRPSLDEILNHNFFKKGPIPKFLPISTLENPPSLSSIKQYIQIIDNEEILDNVEIQDYGVYVIKYLDLSCKYGIGYILSNGYCGVNFNDGSKIILNSNRNIFFYIERAIIDNTQSIINSFNVNNFPDNLKKKVTLLKNFKKYLIGENENIKEVNENYNKNEPFIYVKKWGRTQNVIYFRLTNKVFQIFFVDKSTMILNSNNKAVTYIDKHKRKTRYPIAQALNNSGQEMVKKFLFTRNLLKTIVTKNSKNENPLKKNDINIILEADDKNNYDLKQLKTFGPSEKMSEKDKMNIIFSSTDQIINNISLECKNTDNFMKLKNIILKEYPEFKSKDIFFIVNGSVVEELKTLKENKIEDNNQILIAEQGSFYY